MKKEILNIETVHQCNCCMGCKTLHPLVSVVDLSEANLEQRTIRCDFYTIILIEGSRKTYVRTQILRLFQRHTDIPYAGRVH